MTWKSLSMLKCLKLKMENLALEFTILELKLWLKEISVLNIPPNVKSYPKEVKSGTKTFTKLTALSSVGSSNTHAGYCMLINIKHLSFEARARILSTLDKEELNQNPDLVTDESMNTLEMIVISFPLKTFQECSKAKLVRHSCTVHFVNF